MSSINLMAAGSLRRVMNNLLAEFEQRYAIKVISQFGPAGLLRQRIEQGNIPDLFASANVQHPAALQQAGIVQQNAIFAANTLCLTVRDTPALAGKNWLEIVLDPDLRLATSTPGCDPSGDYTWQLFDNIEQHHAGCGQYLRNKARQLVGGPDSAPLAPQQLAAAWLIESDQADSFIGYRSYAPLLRQQQGLQVIDIPEPYNVYAQYALGLCRPAGTALFEFILSASGQQHLQQAGFLCPVL